MFRPVRKKANEVQTWRRRKSYLHEARRGVLAVSGDDGYRYAVPINYLYDEDAQEIIFHGSKVGHKVDALKRSDKVCFTVVSGESDALCKKFAMKYYPTEKMVDDEVAASGKAVQMFPHQHRPHQRQKGAGEVMKKERRESVLFFIAIKYYRFAEKI